MEFHFIGSKLKQVKENILKKMDELKRFLARMEPEEGPTKFYPHYYGYIRSKVKMPFYDRASNDHLHS